MSMFDTLKRAPAPKARPIALQRRGGMRRVDEIIDPAAFAAALAEALEAADTGASPRAVLLAEAKRRLEAGRRVIRNRFLEELRGGDACVLEGAYLVDVLIRGLADAVADRLYPAPNPTMGERFAILAVGGYGRAELAPQSDIDLLFLLPYKRTGRVEQIVETLLYLLWDLGLKVGHAVRSTAECLRQAKADFTIRTALLEARPLWGDSALASGLARDFRKEVVAGTGADFVAAKLKERDDRHQRMGDSRYVLEPNIKDGKGGLRDLQTLYWIGKYLYGGEPPDGLVEARVLTRDEAARFTRALSFLRAVRCHIHFLTGRAEERLTFDLQAEIARRMGYTDHAGSTGIERFMKHYFLTAKEIGDLTRILCAALEAESSKAGVGRGLAARLFGGTAPKLVDGFVALSGRIDVADERQFRDAPVEMIRIFAVAHAHGLDVHPNALKLITRALRLIGPKLRQDPEANRLFLDILVGKRNPAETLKRMNEAGVLGKFIPDFGRVVAQMQYDMYHVFTVDEHTINCIDILARIDRGELAETYGLATEVATKVRSRRALYVAMLCHDIAKGRGGDHSVLGARVVAKLGPRLGLDEEETETAEWLVRWHLLMSNVAQKRDIDDDMTVRDFAQAVESPERLRCLYVLTVADISGVGPGRWTQWKSVLLGQLFHRARDMMLAGYDVEPRDARVAQAKDAVRHGLADWPDAAVDAFLDKGYPAYWLGLDTETHVRHARLLREQATDRLPLLIDTRVDRANAVTEVTVITDDHPGLFSRLAGALTSAGASIAEARIFTLTDGQALDMFLVQDATVGGALEAPDKLARLSVAIERSLSGEILPRVEIAKRPSPLPSRAKAFRVPPRVLIDNQGSRSHTIIEVNGRDRTGLVFDLTRALTNASVQIASAKIATYGERAVDVFYVKDLFGLKITHESKLAAVREALMKALTDPSCAPAEPAVDTGRIRKRAAARRRARRAESKPDAAE